MNYNDGKWHGWNGEHMKPASIHEETVIDYVWFDSSFEEELCGVIKYRKASENVAWSQVVKFRVIKEHKEPREFWISHNDYQAHDSEEDAISYEDYGGCNHGYFKVREVLDDES